MPASSTGRAAARLTRSSRDFTSATSDRSAPSASSAASWRATRSNEASSASKGIVFSIGHLPFTKEASSGREDLAGSRHQVHPRGVLHRVADKAHLEEIDVEQF